MGEVLWPEKQQRARQRAQLASVSFPLSHAEELKLPALVRPLPERRLANYASASSALKGPPPGAENGRPDVRRRYAALPKCTTYQMHP
jgi:hypothetical protein